MKEEKSSRKAEASCAKNEANLQDVIVQCRLLDEEDVEKERQSNHRHLENSEMRENKNRGTSFLKKIATNLDLDLLHDNCYIAIVLGIDCLEFTRVLYLSRIIEF